MKRFFLLFSLIATFPLSGFYAGVGFGWNSINERYESGLSTSDNKSGKDKYDAHAHRLVPVVKAGQEFFFCNDWFAGISAEWKYLNYRTSNVNSSRGQILPNATFSSINIFGPEVLRDFTSQTCLNNEVLLLATLGKEIFQGYAYLAMGPAFIDASNNIYVSSVHTPNGVGDHLVSTSVKKREIIYGGLVKAGYKLFLCQNTFLDIGYTYLQTVKCRFKNSINAAILNGFDTPGPVNLSLKRDIKFTVQELTLSMNIIF